MEKGHEYPAVNAIAVSLIKMHYVEDENQSDINDEDIPPTRFVKVPENVAQEYDQSIFTALVLSNPPETRICF